MKIQGNLATYEFSDLLQWLAQGNKTGVLRVSDGGVEYKLGFDHGRIDMSSSSDPERRLDNYLHGRGIIDDATLARAERLRDATKMKSGQVLVTLGAVSEEQLARALREKTEEILCELLTWDQGTFEFEGGDRPASTMVPISLEVTKLLLESMHRLDQRRGGQPDPRPEPPAAPARAVAVVVDEPPPADDAATRAIEGLALAEVLDPETPAPATAPADQPAAEEESSDGYLPPDYLAMQQRPGPVQRIVPFAVVAVLTLTGVGVYLANREASAQAADAPAGRPILFTQTVGPRPSLPAATPVVAPAPEAAAVPTPAARAQGESEEALRRRYEQELADLRRELEEARSLGQPAARSASSASGRAVDELPADSMIRAAVTRPEPAPPAEPHVELPAEPLRDGAAAASPTPLPKPEEPAAPAAKPAPAAPPKPEVDARAAQPLELTKPKLLTRPAPRYPLAAMRQRRGATVTLRVLVGPDGRVQEVERLGKKAGMGFDRAAEEAALESTWQSGTRNGEPTLMWAEVRFEFKP